MHFTEFYSKRKYNIFNDNKQEPNETNLIGKAFCQVNSKQEMLQSIEQPLQFWVVFFP